MKKLNVIGISLLAAFLFLACNDEPEFPDPKFDSTATLEFTVRRDTADLANLFCWMEVPNGINYIEVLNASDYETIEKLDQYRGVQQLQFRYSIDISDIVKDTTMAYIVKVYDLKNRTYNKAFQLHVKKFSIPEINMISGENTSVLISSAALQAEIATGMIPIRNVIISLDGAEIYRYEPERDTCDFSLDYLIQGLNEMKKYEVKITLEDVESHRITKLINIYRVDKIERPVKILLGGNRTGEILLSYDDQDRLKTLEYVGEFKMNFEYDFFGEKILSRIEQTNYGQFHDYINYRFTNTFYGQAKSVTETWGHGGEQPRQIVENASYRGFYDKRLSNFVSGAANVQNISYVNGFEEGEYIFAEEWNNSLDRTHNSGRSKMIDFKPVVIPTYIKEFPNPLVYIQRFPQVFHDLFFTKYVHMKTVNFMDVNKVVYNYTYSMDNKGRVAEWRRLQNYSIGAIGQSFSYYYKFIYADSEETE